MQRTNELTQFMAGHPETEARQRSSNIPLQAFLGNVKMPTCGVPVEKARVVVGGWRLAFRSALEIVAKEAV